MSWTVQSKLNFFSFAREYFSRVIERFPFEFLKILGMVFNDGSLVAPYKVSPKTTFYSITICVIIIYFQYECYIITNLWKKEASMIKTLIKVNYCSVSLGVCSGFILIIVKRYRLSCLGNRINSLINLIKDIIPSSIFIKCTVKKITIFILMEVILLFLTFVLSFTSNRNVTEYCLWIYIINTSFLVGMDSLFLIYINTTCFLIKQVNLGITSVPDICFPGRIKMLARVGSAVYDVTQEVADCFSSYLLIATTCEFSELITILFLDIYFSISELNVLNLCIWTACNLLKLLVKLRFCTDATNEVSDLLML